MTRFWHSALLCAALMAPVAAQAQDRDRHEQTYHDRDHNDDHHWDNREDKAYRIWVKENHRKNYTFNRLKEEDQQAYWRWRHEHSDAELKIKIR